MDHGPVWIEACGNQRREWQVSSDSHLLWEYLWPAWSRAYQPQYGAHKGRICWLVRTNAFLHCWKPFISCERFFEISHHCCSGWISWLTQGRAMMTTQTHSMISWTSRMPMTTNLLLLCILMAILITCEFNNIDNETQQSMKHNKIKQSKIKTNHETKLDNNWEQLGHN